MTQFQPAGWPTVTPRIFTKDAENLVAFLKSVFDATGEFSESRPADMRIGDSVVMVSGTAERDSAEAFLYVYVEDADAVYHRAVAAGATSLEEPADVPYGDRRAMVEDPWGNTWQIATPQRIVP